MKNSVVKKLGLFVVLIFSVTVVLPVRVFAVNNDQVILESVVRTPDGKIIEKIQFGKVSIEIVTEGTKLVGTITSGNTTGEWRRVKSSLTGVDSSSDDVRELIVHQDWFTSHFFDILDHAIQIFLKG